MRRSDLADDLAQYLDWAKFPAFVREYHFHPVRRWRIDIVFVDQRIAVECEGGIWIGAKQGEPGKRNDRGAHTGGTGYEKDIQKYNEIALAGWMLLRVSGKMIKSGEALTLIERALKARGRDGNAVTPGDAATAAR